MKLNIASTVFAALSFVSSVSARVGPVDQNEQAQEVENTVQDRELTEEYGSYYYGTELHVYTDKYDYHDCKAYQKVHAYVKYKYCYGDESYYYDCKYKPVEGAHVTMDVIDGPNYGISVDDQYTNEDGGAWFKYQNKGGPLDKGYDEIKVCTYDYYGYYICEYAQSQFWIPCCTECDFSGLDVYEDYAKSGKVLGHYTDNGRKLYETCGLFGFSLFPFSGSFMTVLDTESEQRDSKKGKYDPDLGTPHRQFGGVGRGKGGRPGQKWENEFPLGNALILQDPRYSFPNDDIEGGVMNFIFPYPVYNVSIGLLDIDDEFAFIKLWSPYETYYAVPDIGDNGAWRSDSPKNDYKLKKMAEQRWVYGMSVYLGSSGAITDIHYCPDPYYHYVHKFGGMEAMLTDFEEGTDIETLMATMEPMEDEPAP